tara:strand:+ start:212 stop:1024 length:813 start_codon:yes stop_codon:yes gene_type:complete
MSQIAMYEKENTNDLYGYANFQYEIEKMGTKHLCQGEINKEFLEESLERSDYLFVHSFNGELRGFACVYLDEAPDKHLYVNLICNSKFHNMKTRLTRDDVRLSGKSIMNEIKQLGEILKVKYVKLNAIDNVISYYYSLGYTFENVELQRDLDRQHGLITALRQAQKQDNVLEETRLLDEIVGRFYPGFYNETFQRKIGEEEEDRKEVARGDGIPMIYVYHNHSRGRGRGRGLGRGGKKKRRKSKKKVSSKRKVGNKSKSKRRIKTKKTVK